MSFPKRFRVGVVLATIVSLVGCRSNDCFVCDTDASYLPFTQQIETADETPYCPEPGLPLESMEPPPTVRRPEEAEKWMMSLDEAVEIALANSQVIRDIGGRVLTGPEAVPTIYDPALADSNPRLGVEAALSDFDAQLGMNLFHEQVDRQVNNIFFRNIGVFNSRSDFRLGIDKTAATGTQFTLENLTTYDRNHNFVPGMGNLFPSVYDTIFLAGFRHPLLQGGGVEFNRIAGPNAAAGNYNGVLIARVNTDISLADFEIAIRNLLRDVEQAYWELYFAYRDFNSLKAGRQLALESWELEARRAEAGIRTPDQEAFAREQYYAAQVGVENALSGTPEGLIGVYSVERQLRSLLGLLASDGRLIVPSDVPPTVDVQFDWHESLAYALTRRVELRRQQWQIKRRELELIAARNFEKMRVDFIGQYRWRGFGDELFGEESRPSGSAFGSLFNGNLQDWRIGIEVSTPVGNRIGHTAARNAELQLVRDRAVYDEMELVVASELRAAYTELDRAYVVSRSNYNRRVATVIRLQAERERNEAGQTELDLLLDAQRQAVRAESDYYRSVADYSLALMNLQLARGTLLDRHGITLAEGAWSAEAHQSAAKLVRRFREKHNYCLDTPGSVSAGAFPQRTVEAEVLPLPPIGEPTVADPGSAGLFEVPPPELPDMLDPAEY